MLHFYKFRQDLFGPRPAKDVYARRPAGRGWPEECPPIRAANAFGFDLLANFDITFLRQADGTWKADRDYALTSDFDWAAGDDQEGRPLSQRYAWFWDRGQQIPHAISDNVFEEIKNQVKLSSFLFLATDPNELMLVTAPPHLPHPHSCDGKGWRTIPALVEADWYPASYPWHVVLELDPSRQRVSIEKGEPIARILPVRRDTYFAKPMTTEEFDAFFSRSQRWLSTHGKPTDAGEAGTEVGAGTMDLTRTYVKQQARSRFIVLD